MKWYEATFWIGGFILVASCIFMANSINKESEVKKENPTIVEKPVIIQNHEKPVFCIKVVYFIDERYVIEYSNNNFKTDGIRINEVLDFKNTFELRKNEPVKIQCEIFDTKNEAIMKAKRFKTFEQCERYNKIQMDKYKKLLAYRLANPPEEYIFKERDESKIDKSEVIIHCEP